MPTVEARVQTPRAERYLAQLVEHLTKLGHHAHGPEQHSQQGHGQYAPEGGPGGQGHAGPPVVRHVERTDRDARIEFDWGRFVLTATTTELVLEVHADNRHALARGQELIAHRVETIGRRDELTVSWHPLQL